MFRIFLQGALAALFLVPAAAPAAPAVLADPPAAFGAREGVLDIALSPSGRKVAFISPGRGPATALYTVEVGSEADPKQALAADGKPQRIAGCGWVSDERLICTIYMVMDDLEPGKVLGATRLVAVNADGSNLKLLSRRGRADCGSRP